MDEFFEGPGAYSAARKAKVEKKYRRRGELFYNALEATWVQGKMLGEPSYSLDSRAGPGCCLQRSISEAYSLRGPDLARPIEVTDSDAVDVVVYGATFVDGARGPQARTSATPVNPYQIQFFVDLPQGQGVKMMYVVYFVWDNAQRRGLVYFPGPSDAWYRRNTSTVGLPMAGQWYYATEPWGRALQRAIYAHNDPAA